MNIDPILVLLLALCVLLIGLGMAIGMKMPSHREPTINELAEQAECNGIELIRLRNECLAAAQAADNAFDRSRLQRWAQTAERTAGQHLQCINAIQIESLCKVGAESLATARPQPRAHATVVTHD